MDQDKKEHFKKIDKELENQIFKIFDLDEFDEIVLTKEMLKKKLPLLNITYNTYMLRGMLELPKEFI